MSQVVSNPSPKARFQASTDVITKHRDLVGSREFERAIDFALLHYMRQLAQSSSENFNVAGANQFKQVGAVEFVQVLRNLAETPTVADKERAPSNLNHQV